MKRILLILAVFTLAIATLHAQVPDPILVDPALQSAITTLLPPAYAAYGSLLLVLGMIAGRAFTALKNNGGLLGIYNAIVHGITKPLLLIACLALLTLPSCTTMQKLGAALSTPKAKQIEMGFAQIGLVGAVVGGVVSPGDALTIAKGVAIVTSADDGSSKVVGLTKLGLDTAVAKGVVKQGDVVTINEVTATITPAAAPAAAPAPPVIDLTSGK